MTIEYIPTLPFPSDINSIEDIVGYQERLYQSLTDYFTQMAIIISDEVATVDLDDLANTTLVDPDADRIVFWDDGAGVYTWLAPDGTTIEISGTTLQIIQSGIDHGNLAGLADDDHTQYIKHALSTAASDFLVGSGSNTFIKKTLAETGAILEGDINHDNLQGFLANEHIGHDAVSITAGTGLTGGGDLTESRSLSIEYMGLEDLYDPGSPPGADLLWGWDNTDESLQWITIGANLSYDHASHTLSSTGTDSEKVKVDAAATADYIGAANNDGVLRTSSPLTYADGGDFITLGIDETAIDHNNLLNYDADEHIDWTAVANNGAIYTDGVRLWDTNDSHSMLVYWASDATANQSLSIYGKKGGSLIFDDGGTYSLTIEATSVINQDLSSDASPTFAGIDLGTAMPGTDSRCRVYLSSADQDNIANGSWVTVAIDGETYDTGNDFNTGTYKYTVPVSGFYSFMFCANLHELTSDKRYGVAIYNETTTKFEALSYYSIGTAPASIQLMCHGQNYLTAGDVLHFAVYQNTGAANVDITSGEYSTYGAIHLLSV